MQCPNCQRDLEAREPVYQVSRRSPPYPGVRHECTTCAQKPFVPHDGWRQPKSCENCGRPVFNLSSRLAPEIAACSPRCRHTIKNTRFRAKRKRSTAERACAICGKQFTPKRSDALYCSARCKHKSYRNRAKTHRKPARASGRAAAGWRLSLERLFWTMPRKPTNKPELKKKRVDHHPDHRDASQVCRPGRRTWGLMGPHIDSPMF
jgi:hypothetical protein